MTWSSAACSLRVRARSCGRLRRCKFQRRLHLARQRIRLRNLLGPPKQARAILNLHKQLKLQLPKRSLLLFASGGGRSRSERLRYCSSLQHPRTCRAISWSSCSRAWSASTLLRAFRIRSIPRSCRKRMRSQASSSLVPCCKSARAICSLRYSLSSRWRLLLSISSVASSLRGEC